MVFFSFISVFSDVEAGKRYEYRIQSISGKQSSPLSSSLIYQSDAGHCGNGIVEPLLGEDCDDKNVRGGDGCDVKCRKKSKRIDVK